MHPIILSLIAFVFSSSLHLMASADGSYSASDRLFRNLFADYERNIIPDHGTHDALKVKFSLTVLCAELDDYLGQLKTHAWKFMSWTDTRLIWDPSDFEGVEQLNVMSENLWLPDIRLYNALDLQQEKTRAIVSHNGEVIVVYPVSYDTSASVSSNATITARYKFGSWTYNGFQLDMINNHVDTSSYDVNCRYQIASASSVRNVMRYESVPEPYVDITYTLQLERRAVSFL